MTTSSVPNTHWRALTLAVAIAAAVLPATAQNTPGLRDPMVPPLAIARPAAANASAAEGVAEPPPTPQQLLTVGGRRYVVDGRRRLGVGDTLGSTRIERITDSAVWVRDGSTVTRLPFYGSVAKRTVVDAPTPPSAAPGRRTAPLSSSHLATRGESP
jgi:hypothetical protein